MATITVRALWSRVLVDQSQRQSATISVRVPGPNLISPSTATTGLTALHLVGISSDGTHVVDVNPATLIATGAVSSVNGQTGVVTLTAVNVGADAAGTAATSMATHVSNPDPHTQYLLETDAPFTYSVIGHTHNATAIVAGTLNDARLSANVPLLNAATNTFTGTLSTPRVSVPALITGLTNPFVIRSNTGGTFTEPSHYLGIQGSETTGLAFRSNGQVQFMGQVSVGQFNDIQIGGTSAPFGFTRGTAQNLQLGGVADITADAGTGASVSIGASATTSTTAKQSIWKQVCSWFVATQATRLGQIEEFVADYLTWRRSRRVYSDGARAYTAFTVHTTAPADADLQASEWSVYTDGTGLFAKLKNAASAVYTIALAGGSYTLPTASGSTLGGVKIGSGLSIDGSGVLSATGGGGGGTANGRSWWDDTPVVSYAAPVVVSARGSGTIAGIYGAKTATGTVVVTLKINGTAVTGVDGVTLTTTLQNISATGANTYASGDRITLEYGAVTGSPTNLELTIGGV